MRAKIQGFFQRVRELLPPAQIALLLLGTAILSFGMHNIHRQVGITEGGILGLVLLLDHMLGFPPWLMTTVLDASCYVLGLRFLGKRFILLSMIATVGMSSFYKIWEMFPPMLPDLSANPLLAAVLGSVFVGVGVGLVVLQGGSSGGDDALALVISKTTGLRLAKAYLFTDLAVLLLSLSYIPLNRIAYSLITVTLSSWIIDWIQKLRKVEGRGKSGKKRIAAE
ncbi:MAG: YitT family protein [Clostridia bacterium]